ncbi:MAG TPA: alpha/beta fold hydrolase [Candidatus Angelobacter sp.]|nr:alpha/beta fold hydrolase [Candidatus Angelobacter sp.]
MALGNGVDPAGTYPRFLARPPWWGGDLQTIRNYLRKPAIALDPYPAERLEFPMLDGSDDALVATLNRPLSTAGPRPLVVLIHGLTGCETSTYMRASARHLLEGGYPVLRLNLRGAGPSRPRCRLQYHAGRTEDLRTVLGCMDGRLAANGIVIVGFSLGGNMLLRYLGEQGRRAPLLGAVSVSAPIDLKATQLRLMQRRNRRYHDHLLARMKEEITAPDSRLSDLERARLDTISSVYEFDDRVVAPRNDFANADDYYARCSAKSLLGEIRVPTLLIHARNDPWIPPNAYLAFDWDSNPRLTPLLPKGGGHVGFHGFGNSVPWHDRCIASFLDRLMAARAGRR